MFQSFLNSIMRAAWNGFLWSWAHPVIAGLILAGTAISLLVWLHVPRVLEYYWQNGQITINPFNVRNELPQYVRGRIRVLRFAKKHTIRLTFGRRIGLAFLEFFLKVVWIPDPLDYSWDGGFAAVQVYPLGYSRREYVGLCIKRRMWPWKRTKTLRGILHRNNGYLPGLQETTALTALVGRLYS